VSLACSCVAMSQLSNPPKADLLSFCSIVDSHPTYNPNAHNYMSVQCKKIMVLKDMQRREWCLEIHRKEE
jgi:hypothetical protein